MSLENILGKYEMFDEARTKKGFHRLADQAYFRQLVAEKISQYQNRPLNEILTGVRGMPNDTFNVQYLAIKRRAYKDSKKELVNYVSNNLDEVFAGRDEQTLMNMTKIMLPKEISGNKYFNEKAKAHKDYLAVLAAEGNTQIQRGYIRSKVEEIYGDKTPNWMKEYLAGSEKYISQMFNLYYKPEAERTFIGKFVKGKKFDTDSLRNYLKTVVKQIPKKSRGKTYINLAKIATGRKK